jgi:hypothetical protein
MQDVDRRLRSEPPFELPLHGIDGHQVLIGSDHAAFLFWGDNPESALIRASGRAEVQTRILDAVEGLTAGRKLESVYEQSAATGPPSSSGRAAGLLLRGRELPSQGRSAALQTLSHTANLARLRIFKGEATAVATLELDGESGGMIAIDDICDAIPIERMREPEQMRETFWFEADDRRPTRSNRTMFSR